MKPSCGVLLRKLLRKLIMFHETQQVFYGFLLQAGAVVSELGQKSVWTGKLRLNSKIYLGTQYSCLKKKWVIQGYSIGSMKIMGELNRSQSTHSLIAKGPYPLFKTAFSLESFWKGFDNFYQAVGDRQWLNSLPLPCTLLFYCNLY